MDRTKNLFKLSQGEYVAPEKVEQTYLFCNLIQHVYVEGHSLKPYAVAVVKPNFRRLRKEAVDIISKFAKKISPPIGKKCENMKDGELLEEITDAELCTSKEIREFILERMNLIAREKGLKGFELVSLVYNNRFFFLKLYIDRGNVPDSIIRLLLYLEFFNLCKTKI